MRMAAASAAEVGLCPEAMMWGDQKKQCVDDRQHGFIRTKALLHSMEQ